MVADAAFYRENVREICMLWVQRDLMRPLGLTTNAMAWWADQETCLHQFVQLPCTQEHANTQAHGAILQAPMHWSTVPPNSLLPG